VWCGERYYDFMKYIESKDVEYLAILQKYCNEKEWKKIRL
jgi:hypothetical protein